MGVIRAMFCATALGISAIAGGFVGYNAALDREYKIVRADDTTSLYCRQLNKSYVLTQIEDDFYMGDVEHNLQGVRVLPRNGRQLPYNNSNISRNGHGQKKEQQ